MLRLVTPTVSKIQKDLAFLKALNEANEPNPNCGVRYLPFDYFMTPQPIEPKANKGVAMFPGTLSPEQWQAEAKKVEVYQQKLLAKYEDFKK